MCSVAESLAPDRICQTALVASLPPLIAFALGNAVGLESRTRLAAAFWITQRVDALGLLAVRDALGLLAVRGLRPAGAGPRSSM